MAYDPADDSDDYARQRYEEKYGVEESTTCDACGLRIDGDDGITDFDGHTYCDDDCYADASADN